MNLKLYKYGLSNTLEAIEKALVNALNANNKKEKDKCINKALGMVEAIDMLIDETELINETEEEN